MFKYLLLFLSSLSFFLTACPDCGGTCGDCDEEKPYFLDIDKIQKQADDSHNSYKYWRKAKLAFTKQDYETAVSLINNALNNETHKDNAFFKLERAKMKQMAGDINSSLEDLIQVIKQRENQKLFDIYYIKALYGAVSIIAHYDLKEATRLYEKIRKYDADIPIVEINQDEDGNNMIYSNLSSIYEDKTVRQLLIRNLIQFGLANSEEDVEFTPSNTVIVRLPKCMENKQVKELAVKKDPKKIEFCKENCTTIATGAMVACGYLPTNKCRIACTATVEGLRRACNWCCDSGDFYTKCIRPLEQFFPPPCDPAWD